MSTSNETNVVSIGKNTGSNIGTFAFMQKTYEETLDLLSVATDYFYHYGKRDRATLTNDERVMYTVAMSTITIQLTSVLSWLMAQKAVEKGEITLEESMSEKYCLNHLEGYTSQDEAMLQGLKNPIPQMLKRSSGLYGRVKRLEESMNARVMLQQMAEVQH